MEVQGMPFSSPARCSLILSKEKPSAGRQGCGGKNVLQTSTHSSEMPVFIACAVTFLADYILCFLIGFLETSRGNLYPQQGRSKSPQRPGWGLWRVGSGCGPEAAGEAGPGLFTASLTHWITVPLIDLVNRSKEMLEKLSSKWIISWCSIFICPPAVTSMVNF